MAASKKALPEDPNGLNPKQRLFVLEYLKDFNATEAAKRAGYSKKTAKQIGSRLLTQVDVSAAIADTIKSLINKPLSDIERIVLEAVRLAHSDVRKAFDKDGQLVDIHALPDDVAAAISSIEVQENPKKGPDGEIFIERVRKIRFWDKNSALRLLAQYHRMLVERTETEVKGEVKHTLEAERERVRKLSPAQLRAELQAMYDQIGRELGKTPK